MYRKGKEVSKGDIDKTYILLREKAVDYVSWITNVPLNINHRYSLPKELDEHLGRISPLNELELAYISFMVNFEEIFQREPIIQEVELILTKIGLNPIHLKTIFDGLPKLTEIEPQKTIPEITSFSGNITTSVTPKPKKRTPKIGASSAPIESIEIGVEQVKEKVNEYVNEKSSNVTKITSAYTIKAVKNKLQLAPSDKKWDEDIWAYAINATKSICLKQTPKTIFFS
jgi:hypothetical protein